MYNQNHPTHNMFAGVSSNMFSPVMLAQENKCKCEYCQSVYVGDRCHSCGAPKTILPPLVSNIADWQRWSDTHTESIRLDVLFGWSVPYPEVACLSA